jgi:hypothetical protein
VIDQVFGGWRPPLPPPEAFLNDVHILHLPPHIDANGTTDLPCLLEAATPRWSSPLLRGTIGTGAMTVTAV